MFNRQKKAEFAVIGLGRFGRGVVKMLREKGHSVLGIDRDPEHVQYISEFCTQAVVIDSTNEDSLRALDIASFDTVVVAIGSDFESNLITTVALKSLGVRRVVCKALSTRQKEILLRVGADHVVQPEADAGRRLGLELAMPNLLDQISLGDEHSILEMRVPASLVGKTLIELDFRNRFGSAVVAVKHEKSVTVAPGGDVVLDKNDVIVVIGRTADISQLAELS